MSDLKSQLLQNKENTLKRDKVIQGLMAALKGKEVSADCVCLVMHASVCMLDFVGASRTVG